MNNVGLGSGFIAVGAGIAVGLSAIGSGIGTGSAVKGGLLGMAYDPERAKSIQTSMFIGCGIVGNASIYGLLVALILIFSKMN